MAQFVMDTLGRPDVETLRILQPDPAQFSESVRVALPRLPFVPAEVRGASFASSCSSRSGSDSTGPGERSTTRGRGR
jgi:hypothetical protein